MKILKIETNEIGENGFWTLRYQIDNFVADNFSMLYEGAVRLGFNIEEDDYAGARIQINKTRLHSSQHLKYADGHKYDNAAAPSEGQLKNTIKDIQALIDAASEVIDAPFQITISNGK